MFDLIGAGFDLMRSTKQILWFGVGFGLVSAIPYAFMDSALGDITPESTEAELREAAEVLLWMTPFFILLGMLSLLAYAVLVTFTVRTVQVGAPLGDAIERARRRIWALVLYGPFAGLVLVGPFLVVTILAVAAESTAIAVFGFLAFLVVAVVYGVGMWAAVPAFTVSDVRLRYVFHTIWRGARNGGLRFLGLSLLLGLLSLVVSGLGGMALATTPFPLVGAMVQGVVSGVVAAWTASAVAYLWQAESPNIAIGLRDTRGGVISEDTLVFELPVQQGPIS